MLNVYFGDMPNAIYNTSLYFDNTYLDSWITDEFGRKVIKSIDKGTVLSAGAVDTKALGVIPVKQISGGTKTLLLIHNEPDKVFNASNCGDNCAKWILKIADMHKEDITINLRHMMDFGDKDFTMRILNNNTVIHTMKEYVLTVGNFL